MWKGLGLHLGWSDPQYYALVYTQSMGKKARFDADTPLALVFSGGEQVQLLPAEASAGRRTVLGLMLNNRKAETLYEMSAAQMQRLREGGLQHLLLSYKAGDEILQHEFPFQGKNGRRLSEYAGCVMDTRFPDR